VQNKELLPPHRERTTTTMASRPKTGATVIASHWCTAVAIPARRPPQATHRTAAGGGGCGSTSSATCSGAIPPPTPPAGRRTSTLTGMPCSTSGSPSASTSRTPSTTTGPRGGPCDWSPPSHGRSDTKAGVQYKDFWKEVDTKGTAVCVCPRAMEPTIKLKPRSCADQKGVRFPVTAHNPNRKTCGAQQ